MRAILFITLIFTAYICRAGELYTLNPGDVLRISVWNEKALQHDVMVLPDGTISFPLVGILTVVEKSPAEVQELIKEALSRVIPDPEINVTVSGVNGNNVFVIGKVSKPGQIPMIQPIDVMQALSLAGGLTTYAKSDSIQIIRRTSTGQKVIKFDYENIAEGVALETNVLLKSGDTIVVP
jgi:polysaccharide export outer membrane protein